MERFFAKSFMGGKRVRPGQLEQRAEVHGACRDAQARPGSTTGSISAWCTSIVGNYAGAREQFEVIATLPVADVGDPMYKRDAAAMLTKIAGKK